MKLATRIMMLVAVITFLMGILTITLSGPVIKQGFRAMDKEWIESLTLSLSEGIAQDTINGNAARVRQVLETVVQRNKELDYAYIVDFDEKIFAHTFEDGFPEKLVKLIRANQEHRLSDIHTRHTHAHSESLQLDGETIEDISRPIIEGLSANLHLGLNNKIDAELIQAIDQKLIVIIFMLGLFGILIALPFSRRLTRPLERLGQLMQDYGSDKLEGQFEIPRGSSETQKLGDAFNKMIEARSLVKDALSESEDRLEEAQRIAHVGSWEWVAETDKPAWSRELCAILEVDPNKPAPTLSEQQKIYTPESIERMNTAVENTMQTGTSYEIELERVREDGTRKWLLARGEPWLDEEGNLKGLRGTALDITERKQAEEALQAASELNERIIGESPVGLAIYDFSGQCIAANTSVAEMIGATREQVLEQNYTQIESWKKSGLLDAANRCIHLQEKERHEFDVMTTFGKRAFFDCVFVPFKLHGEQQLLLMLDNISDRRAAEDALKESELLMKNMYNSLDEAVLVVSPDRKIVNVNQAARSIFGYSMEELLSSSTELFHVDHQHYLEFGDRINQAFSEDKNANFEFVAKRKNGEIFPSEHTVSLMKDPSGMIKGIVSVVRDITERKTAEAELTKHREHLEELVVERTRELHNAQEELVRKERLATLGQLTATVSHELRNPLGAMRPSLYLIKKMLGEGVDEKLLQSIDRLDRNVMRCDHIIDELLDFTRITEMERHATRIDEWLESVLAEQNIPDGIQLEKDFSLKDIELEIDTDRLRRAVINVVENGCHAMQDEHQQLVVDRDARLQIQTRSNDKRIEIVVTDTGSGIPEDVSEKVFEPLFSTKGFGVGLGMPTVKQIMEQHGGGVEITTEMDKGTSVILWLPKNISAKDDDGAAQ